jgi:hypothetical protein
MPNIANFNNTTPAAPEGRENVGWQRSGYDISINIPLAKSNTRGLIQLPSSDGKAYGIKNEEWFELALTSNTENSGSSVPGTGGTDLPVVFQCPCCMAIGHSDLHIQAFCGVCHHQGMLC